MQEFDIHTVWKKENAKATDFYQEKRSQIVQLAQQRSRNIFKKIGRNTKSELVFNFVLLVFIVVLLRDIDGFLLTGIILFSLLSLGLSIRFYWQYHQKIKAAFSYDIAYALPSCVQILKAYRTHLKIYFLMVLPFCIFLGYIAGFHLGQGSWRDLMEPYIFRLSIVLIGLCLPLAYFLLNKYLKWLLGNRIEELEIIINDLSEE